MSAEAISLHPVFRPQGLLDEVLRSRAAALARGGALPAAAGLLQTAVEAGSDHPATLDLLARIRAQSGEWAEAEKLWLQVARQQPGHAGAAAELARLRAARRPPGGMPAWAPLAITVVLVAAVLAMLLWQRAVGREQQQALAAMQSLLAERLPARGPAGAAAPGEPASGPRLADLAGAQQTLSARLADNEARWERALAAFEEAAAAAAPLQLAFKVPGVRGQREGTALALALEGDAFDEQNRLVPRARARLRTLARAIVMTQERVVIEVATAAADEAVARQRTEAATGALRETGLFPRHAIRGAASGAGTGTASVGSTSSSTASLTLRVRRVPPPPAKPATS